MGEQKECAESGGGGAGIQALKPMPGSAVTRPAGIL
jgi:hypothetical protein